MHEISESSNCEFKQNNDKWELGLVSTVYKLKIDNCIVKAIRINHRVFTLGYSIHLPETAGNINMDYLNPILIENEEFFKKYKFKHPNEICRYLKVSFFIKFRVDVILNYLITKFYQEMTQTY